MADQRFYAVQNPTFQRAMRNILSITNAAQALVTTTFDGVNPGAHQYSSGLIVRLLIPNGWGMVQADQFSGPITVINSTQFTVPLNTTSFTPFTIPPTDPVLHASPGGFSTPPQVLPLGEINDILTMATQNVLPYPVS